MGLLISIGIKQIKNYLKSNKLALLMVIFFIGMFALSFVSQDMNNVMPYGAPELSIEAAGFIIALAALLLSFAQAGTLLISKAEANMFFVSPIKEHNILIYIFLKGSYQLFLFLLVFTNFNINIIRPYYHLNNIQFLMLYLWEALLVLTIIMSGIFLLMVRNKNLFIYRALEVIVFGGTALILIGFLLSYNSIGATNIESILENVLSPKIFNEYFSKDIWKFVPISGLFINAAKIVTAPDLSAYLSIGGIILINIIFILSPYYIKVNMAEPALEIAEKNFNRRLRKKSGQSISITNKVKDSIPIRFTGYKAIISKQWIDYRRSSKLFLSSNVLNIGLVMAIYFVILKVTNWSVESGGGIDSFPLSTFMTYFFIFIIMIISLFIVSPLPKDILSPAIFLIPEKSFKKIVAISVVSNFEIFAKAVLLFIFGYGSGIAFGVSMVIALMYFFILSASGFIDLFAYSVFLDAPLMLLRSMVAGFLKSIVLLIILGIYAAFVIMGYTSNGEFILIHIPALVICAIVTFVIDALVIFISEGIIDNRQ
ncbi:putative ABC exporter domain-containing protein [Anaeropeptidivorans aminofermentans]|jgi:hypothetical protein|uniref:putative ABC exporter domain-containing protein n=1 Tax=Anaeropeptidivorans aminofermentans TaxID=2934315 RepID=UPI002024F3D1|nr:putative ABC exporter domain-containing protein [Anaeropeptidivorans aminofermentans]